MCDPLSELRRARVRGSSWRMTSRRATTCCSSTAAREPTTKGRRRAPSESSSRPDCGLGLCTVAEKVDRPVGSPLEAEYHALIRGLKLAVDRQLSYVAVFSDSRNLVNQVTLGWSKNEQATQLYEEVEEALKPFKGWQLSWLPRETNKEADKLVDQAFGGEPAIHATE